MSLTLSSSDLKQTAHAIRLLTAPFDHPDADRWRSAVNRHLRQLLRADTAGFMLPVEKGLVMYSEGHAPEELARYVDFPPPPSISGIPGWQRLLDLRVANLQQLYQKELPSYLASPYYNEYAAPNRAHDTLGMGVSLLGDADPRRMASLQLWHDRPDSPRFGRREIELMRLLYPAFQAGVETWASWRRQKDTLLSTLDRLEQPTLVCDMAGRALHATPALADLFHRDPESGILRAHMEELASELSTTVSDPDDFGRRTPTPIARQVRTRYGDYRLRGFLYRQPPAGDAPLVVVTIRRFGAKLPAPQELRKRFGLTPRQAEVALLLARRKTNPEIAEILCISPHTARRHSEAVMGKLDIRSRQQVASAIRP